ncbi:glycosyltransferase [Cyclobacterium salsum]|uniref:glycosyltransferase n=1 Tax=Cyclobacterium salsum TaxID=2666329 RepID=UPI0013919176|nr:glycosyltransferase [Cyclobacterium salsum]
MKDVYFFINIASHYRGWLWLKILQSSDFKSSFFFGGSGSSGIKTINLQSIDFSKYADRFFKVNNVWLGRRILIWQTGIIMFCIKSKMNVAIFTGEMYCLSTWIAALICRIRKIEVVFWGHGLYGNEGIVKLFIRNNFNRLADKHLLYERRAKKLMVDQGFENDNLYVVFNSLDYDYHRELRQKIDPISKSEAFPFFNNLSVPVIVFIGRLTSLKRLDILLDAIKRLNSGSLSANLLIIGEGPERSKLEEIGKSSIDDSWLHFTGACYDEELIGHYLSKADLCVSPGNVGLTAIHSLSFGTPVATHSNLANQMPEVEAIIDGYNGFLFKENDVDDLSFKIKDWLENNSDRNELRQRCFEVVDSYYNPSYQMSVFNRLVKGENPEI